LIFQCSPFAFSSICAADVAQPAWPFSFLCVASPFALSSPTPWTSRPLLFFPLSFLSFFSSLLPPGRHSLCCCLLHSKAVASWATQLVLLLAALQSCCRSPSLRTTPPLSSSCSLDFSRPLHRLALPHLEIFFTTTPPPCRSHGPREILSRRRATEVTRRRLPQRPSQRHSPH
jgi:hypothetical protein